MKLTNETLDDYERLCSAIEGDWTGNTYENEKRRWEIRKQILENEEKAEKYNKQTLYFEITEQGVSTKKVTMSELIESYEENKELKEKLEAKD